MTRRRYVFDEARVQRFLAEGRGTGDGPHYRPWLQVQDVSSMGRSHRPFGIKTQRVHHLLSDGALPDCDTAAIGSLMMLVSDFACADLLWWGSWRMWSAGQLGSGRLAVTRSWEKSRIWHVASKRLCFPRTIELPAPTVITEALQFRGVQSQRAP